MEKRLKNKKRGPAALSVLIATMLAVTLFVAALPADGSGSSRESRTLGATGDYHPDDVAVINSIIENNGLYWTPDDLTDWDGVLWNDASPKRIVSLRLSNLDLTGTLDVSGLTSLIYLDCNRNYLTSLDLSGLTSLIYLDCNRNYLTSLDLSGLTSLTYLDCNLNNLTSLDLSGLTSLTNLDCSDNYLTSLDLSGLTSLTKLACYDNNFTELDLSGLTSLTYLDCSYNYLTELDLSGLTSLTRLYCSDNYLTSLDMSGLTSLTYLDCRDNYLTSLDRSSLTSLTYLYCSFNYFTELDLSGLTSLTYLDCRDNYLTSLDLSGLTSLISLDCTYNYITSLDLSDLNNLSVLFCERNLLVDENKVTLTGTPIEQGEGVFYFGIQFKAVEITYLDEADISEAIDDIIKEGIYEPLIIGTITSNTGTLTINTDSGKTVHWRAAYIEGALEINGNGKLLVSRPGIIAANEMLIRDDASVVVVRSGTIAVSGNLIIENEFSPLFISYRGKVTVGGDLIAENIASNEYAVVAYGEITVLGDAISSGRILMVGYEVNSVVGGNAIAGGDYAFFCNIKATIHVKGDVSVPNGIGAHMLGGTVKIDGTLTVKEGEAYILDEYYGESLFADDFSSENTNGYAFVYTNGYAFMYADNAWQVLIGLNEESEGDNGDGPGTGDGEGSEIGGDNGNGGSETGSGDGNGTTGGDGSETGTDGDGSEADGNGLGTGSGDGNGGSDADGNDRTYAIIVSAAAVIGLCAVVALSIRKKKE